MISEQMKKIKLQELKEDLSLINDIVLALYRINGEHGIEDKHLVYIDNVYLELQDMVEAGELDVSKHSCFEAKMDFDQGFLDATENLPCKSTNSAYYSGWLKGTKLGKKGDTND